MDDIINKLCGTIWLAGLEQDDFIQSIEFRADGTGRLLYGYSQATRASVNFHYFLVSNNQILFEYQKTKYQVFEDIHLEYQPSKDNDKKLVSFTLSEGLFSIEEPYGMLCTYGFLLYFEKEIYPSDLKPPELLLDYYGNLVSQELTGKHITPRDNRRRLH